MQPENLNKVLINQKVNYWYWPGELNFVNLVENNQSSGMKVVEVGCYDGSTTRKYIDIVKKNNGHVYIIDTFMGSPSITGSSHPHSYGNHNLELYSIVKEKFAKYSDMITIMKGYSYDCILELPNDCDIIFIDADHAYESCRKDIEVSIPKVKKSGILCGHDCETFDYVNTYTEEQLKGNYWNNHHPGVSQAVFDFFGITERIGSVWYKIIN
jgi:hypothetical protein